MVVDTAKGVGGDYSAFTIIDASVMPYKLVGKLEITKFLRCCTQALYTKLLESTMML